MTRTRTSTPPQHGERRCYLRGCRQPECSAANYRYMSRIRLDYERGQTRRVPSGPAAARVELLRTQGWTARQIAAAAGCSERAVQDLSVCLNPTVNRELADRILHAKVSIASAPHRTYVNATGTVRRVQALMAMGHSVHAIAGAIGIAPTALSPIINGRYAKVTIATARGAIHAYAMWSHQVGPSQRSRNRATKRGWAPPAAWDDEALEDPEAKPQLGQHTPRYIALAENCAELERQGYTHEQIAERLNVTRDGLQRALAEYRKRVVNSSDMRKAA